MKGDYDRAIPDLDEAIRLNPRYALAYEGRGKVYHSKGDHENNDSDDADDVRCNGDRPGYVARVSPDETDDRSHDEHCDHRC